MVKHYVGVPAAKAKMLDLDRLGTNLAVAFAEGEPPIKVRLPFVRCGESLAHGEERRCPWAVEPPCGGCRAGA